MKKIIGAALLIVCLLSLCVWDGMLTEEPESSAAPVVMETGKAPQRSVTDHRLRDNSALYREQDRTEVVTMYLTIGWGNKEEGTDHSWEEINSLDNYYYSENGIPRYQVSALLQVGDEDGPLPGEPGYGETVPNATVQIRGQTSSRNAQKSYKIELKDNKGLWNDQSTINLNKHMADGLRFRNKLMFDLMTEVPQIMSLRTQFVHLYVKDAAAGETEFSDYGLYTQVEQLNRRGMRAHGLNREGQLYKLNFFEFYPYEEIRTIDDPAYDEAAFSYRIEIKGNRDHSKLIGLLNAVNDYGVPAEELFSKHVDEENIAYWMAYMILMGNLDTASRNMYLYSPLNSTKWYIIPWDNDAALMLTENAIIGRVDGGSWESGVSNYWGNMLFRRCLMSEQFRETLDMAIRDLLNNTLTREKITEAVKSYRRVVAPYLYRMPDVLYASLTAGQYDRVARGLYDEIRENYRLYLDSLEKPMPFFMNVPSMTGEGLSLNWEASYSLDSQSIRYSVSLARDYSFRTPLAEEKDLFLPEVTLNVKLEPGQYFLRVQAQNEAGKTQGCFNYYVTDAGKIYDTYCFYVLEDGTCQPDIYGE